MPIARLLYPVLRHGAVAIALCFPLAALADRTGVVALAANAAFNLDSGKISSTGDIFWTGSAINFQGAAVGGTPGP